MTCSDTNDPDDESSISENPSFSEFKEQLQGMDVLSGFLKLLNFFGVIDKKAIEELDKLPQMKAELERLSQLPDKFNAKFASLGWIAHSDMNVTVMEEALELAGSGRIEDAELMLCEHFDGEQVRFLILRMTSITAFMPRQELAWIALDEYNNKKYYTCVPLILMLIDGLVQSINQTSFFADCTEMIAWDSIAGHSSGLNVLKELFNTQRRKTRTEKISIPYRNGIMHGVDLGYGSKLVAAKCWNALSAVGEWARKVEKGEREEPVRTESKTSFLETVHRMAENKRVKRLLGEWKPRDLESKQAEDQQQVTTHCEEGSPEKTLLAFLELWQSSNYGKMSSMMTHLTEATPGAKAGRMRKLYGQVSIKRYEILEIEDEAPGITNIVARLQYLINCDETRMELLSFRLISVRSDSEEFLDVVPRNHPDAVWRINEFGVPGVEIVM